MDIIKQMRDSGNKLLQTEAEDIALWSKLKHNKEDLQLFLNHNIAEISFVTNDGSESQGIFTSNMALVKIISETKKQNKQKIAKKIDGKGIITKDPFSVDSWDLLDNKRKTISLKSWQILNYISISPKNVLVLDEVLKKILGK